MRGARTIALATVAPALVVGLLVAFVDCDTAASGPCPLRVPTDNALCNSGGVVVYCHYDCTADAGTTFYATCSGPRWSVVASGLDCSRDSGVD